MKMRKKILMKMRTVMMKKRKIMNLMLLMNEINIKYFGEIFNYKYGDGDTKASECNDIGTYVLISHANNKKCYKWNCNGENLFICGTTAYNKNIFKTKIKYYVGKCSYSKLMIRLIPVMSNISLKYFYYYFNFIKEKIEVFSKSNGNGIKNLDII